MLIIILFIIFVFLLGSAWLFFKCKIETEDLSSAFDLFSSRFLEMLNSIIFFKKIGIFFSKVFQFIFKRKKKNSEINIQEMLDAKEAEEILKNDVSEHTIKAMGIDFRELRELAEAERKFRSKVVKHIVNNRLIYKEGGRLKMVVPLEAMTFLHKNLSPLVNNRGEITLSIKEEKCKIALDEIDDLDFKEYIMMNGLNEQIYSNREARDTAINTAKIFYNKAVSSGNIVNNSNSTALDTSSKIDEEKKEIIEDNIVETTDNKNMDIDNKKEMGEKELENEKNETDFLDDILSTKPKTPNTDIQISDAKTVLTEILKEDDDYNVKKPIPKEKASVTAMKKHLNLLKEFNDQDIEKLMDENADKIDNALKTSGIVLKNKNTQEAAEQQVTEHSIEIGISEADMDATLGAVKESKEESVLEKISDDEVQQAFSQMAEENSVGWDDETEENVFSIEDFKSENPSTIQNQQISDTAETITVEEEEDDIGEISKISNFKKTDNNLQIDRTIELVHNKPFGNVGAEVENIDFKKSFSMYFKKSAELRKALAINIVKTRPIILNDNKQFMFISEFQIGAALCKLFAPDDEKYYQLLEPMLKNPQNRMHKEKFLAECKDTLNSLSKDGNGVFTSKNFEIVNFVDKQGKFYFSNGWRVKPEIFQIAFEGIEKADNVLSYARWISEPLNDNISIAKNYSMVDKETTRPLIPKLDSSIFV